jgi:aminoglycoside phosphotransferase (APT) family kinase protein
MEHVEGRIFKDVLLPGMTPSQRREIYLAMCKVLAQIHSVNLEATKLADFGRPGLFVGMLKSISNCA